jgi:hypothetical protein
LSSGFGKYIWKNEDVYEGNFVENKKCGKGKIVRHNGDVYEGDWEDDFI